MANKIDLAAEMAKMMGDMPQMETHKPSSEPHTHLPVPEQTLHGEPPAETSNQPCKRTTCFLPVDLLEKIRAVCDKEDVTVRSVIETGINMFMSAYEAKHGPITPSRPKKKGDASSLI